MLIPIFPKCKQGGKCELVTAVDIVPERAKKPAAPSVKMLTEQIELAKEMGVKFVCVPIHPMRYDLNVAKQIINDGTIGDPYYVRCNLSHGGPEYFQYRDSDPTWFFEPGAGALVDMGVHGLQIVTSVMGSAKKFACMAKVTTPQRIFYRRGVKS